MWAHILRGEWLVSRTSERVFDNVESLFRAFGVTITPMICLGPYVYTFRSKH